MCRTRASGIVRAFLGELTTHLEDQIEEENEEKLRKNERKYRRMRKIKEIFLSCPPGVESLATPLTRAVESQQRHSGQSACKVHHMMNGGTMQTIISRYKKNVSSSASLCWSEYSVKIWTVQRRHVREMCNLWPVSAAIESWGQDLKALHTSGCHILHSYTPHTLCASCSQSESRILLIH